MGKRWMNVTTPTYRAMEYPAGYMMGSVLVDERDSIDVKAETRAEARRLAYPLFAKIRGGYIETQRGDCKCPFRGWEVYVYPGNAQEAIEDGAA